MRAYRFRLVLNAPARHVIERPIAAADETQALERAHERWRRSPVWEYDNLAELLSDTGEVIWRQAQRTHGACPAMD